MKINPLDSVNVAPQAVQPVDSKNEKHTAPETTPIVQKDSVVLSQAGKDLAAKMAGKTMQEESKESPGVENQEEQAKTVK